MAFIDDIKRIYKQSTMLKRIIFINIAVCVLLNVVALLAFLFKFNPTVVLSWVEMPSDLGLLLRRPWTIVTYMFAHFNWWHILFNMLWLYWLGHIFMEYFSPKQLMGVYLLGGWGGAALYLLALNLFPHLASVHPFLIGASASVIAIVVATAVYAPDYKIGLLFLGQVPLKWIAIVTVAITVLGLDATNPGASIAHIGGALVGAWFALRIKHGKDITRPLNAVIDACVGLFNGRSFKMPRFKRPVAGKQQRGQQPQQPVNEAQRSGNTVSEQELDVILGKIKAAGYDALTDEEKDKLFKASRRRNA